MMTDWYQKAIDALQLNGLGVRTQEAYVRALRMLCEFYHKTPDEISESELQQYFLQRKNGDGWSPNTMRICYCGIRHFFVHVLRRDWHTLELVRAQSERRLPSVLSVEEVRSVLAAVRTPHHRAFLATVYACGLRLQEAQCLEVSDIDSRRMMIHVHRGKGAKDRFVPLALIHPADPAQALVEAPPSALDLPRFGSGPQSGRLGRCPHAEKQRPGSFPAGQARGRHPETRHLGAHAAAPQPPICSRPESTCG